MNDIIKILRQVILEIDNLPARTLSDAYLADQLKQALGDWHGRTEKARG